MKKTYEFENLGCAHCAGKMEEKIGKLPDVESVNLSFPMKKMYVETSREDLLPEIQKICTDIEPDVIVTEVTKKSSKRRKHVEEDSHESHEHHHHHDDDDCCCGHDHDHDADEVFTSWGKETTHKYTEAELNAALTALGDVTLGTVLRAKGIVPCADGGEWLHFDYVPGAPEIRRGSADYTGRLCVIGSELDEERIASLFGVN